MPSIGRSLQGVASVWDQVWSLGLAGSNPMSHWVHLKQSMSQLVQLVVRQYGYESYCLIYLISSWMLLVYIVTTRIVWSCQRTWCSMTSRSISGSSITILWIWCVITQNIPKVVEGNLKVIAKITSERNWLFFLERNLSDINLTRPYIWNQYFKSSRWLKQHIYHWEMDSNR